MKKLMFMLIACMALTACTRSKDVKIPEYRKQTFFIGDVEFVVSGLYVVLPEWIDEERMYIATDPRTWPAALIGFSAEYNGEAVIFFDDIMSHAAREEVFVYTLRGKKSEKKVKKSDMTNINRFCPYYAFD